MVTKCFLLNELTNIIILILPSVTNDDLRRVFIGHDKSGLIKPISVSIGVIRFQRFSSMSTMEFISLLISSPIKVISPSLHSHGELLGGLVETVVFGARRGLEGNCNGLAILDEDLGTGSYFGVLEEGVAAH